MAKQLNVTRIDFTTVGDQIVVNKIDDQTTDHSIIVENSQKSASSLEDMLTWCEGNGWTVRRFAPLGARAWKGGLRPVRTAIQIKRKRDELTLHLVEGLNVVALDLAYDC